MLSNVPRLKPEDVEGNLKSVIDYLNKLKQELEFKLLNLDSDNVTELDGNIVNMKNIKMDKNASISWDQVTGPPNFVLPQDLPTEQQIGETALKKINATYIDANGVWTPQVYANQINTLLGKITTAQIVNLEVGSNVTMGANAAITWNNLPSDVASTSDIQEVPSYITATKITRTTIESPSIVGGTLRQSSGGGTYGDVEVTAGRVQFFNSSGMNTGVIVCENADNKMYVEGTKALKLSSLEGNVSVTGKKIYLEGDVFVNGQPLQRTIVFS